MSEHPAFNRPVYLMQINTDGSSKVHVLYGHDINVMFDEYAQRQIINNGRWVHEPSGEVWIDMIWAALHYEKLAEAAALQVSA